MMLLVFSLLFCLLASSVRESDAGYHRAGKTKVLNGAVGTCRLRKRANVFTERDLKRHIFADYDKDVRPASHPDNTINVAATISPISIKELDPKNQVLVMDTFLKMKWNDDFLKWDPSEFNNISMLRLPNNMVWKPDLSVYTASPDDALFPTSNTNVILFHDGTVLWVPYFTIKSRCPLMKNQEKNYFECVIKIGSWTYNGKLLNPLLYSPEVDVKDFVDNNLEWKLVTVKSDRQSKFYPCCPGEDYPVMHFNVTLKRRWPSMSMDNQV